MTHIFVALWITFVELITIPVTVTNLLIYSALRSLKGFGFSFEIIKTWNSFSTLN